MLRFPVFVLLLLLPLPAMAAIAIDGSNSAASGASTAVPSLTTTKANDIIIVLGECDTLAGGSLSISDTAGLSWTARKTLTYNSTGSMVEWYAKASSNLSSDSITVTLGTGCTGSQGRATAFGISGANQSTIFDANASLPATNAGTSGTSLSVTGVSTSNANDLAFCQLRYNFGGSSASGPSGFGTFVSGGTGSVTLLTDQMFSATQSGVTWTMSWSGTDTGHGMICDAVMQASSGGTTFGPIMSVQ